MSSSLTDKAAAHCKAQGHRFTDPRRDVLGVVAGAGKPLSAYDILGRMTEGTKPPTVYRALEFWEREGFVHRIGSLNLYTVCHAGHRHDGAQFLVCDACGGVEEIHMCDMPDALESLAEKSHFHVARWNVELHGMCRACAD